MSDQSKEQQEQEVDLVPVFVWIGNGFKNLFRGIGKFFAAIGHFLILFLIFIQKNVILIGALTLIGAALGYYANNKASDFYTAQVRVQPNFNSSAQLISNVRRYQSLVYEEAYDMLATELNSNENLVAQITDLSIEASFNDTELLKEYDYLARRSDTIALENFTFDGFKEAKREIDYEFYNLEMTARSREALEQLIEPIVFVKDNSAIKAQRLATKETVAYDLKSQEAQLAELDSLLDAYKVAIKTTQSSSGGTNFYVGDRPSTMSLTQLFEKKTDILISMGLDREDKYGYDNTVNIVSQLVKKGALVNKHLIIKSMLIFFGIGLLIALIPIVWRFLNNYEARQEHG